MDAAADRPEFEPPPQNGLWRGFALAVLAHVLLFVALTFGLRWQRDSEDVAVEAELWARLPQEAAPKEVPPPPAPKPVVQAPPPPPAVQAPPQPKEPDIALEQEKRRRELEEERRLAEEARQREEQRRIEARRKHEEELARRKREEEELARKKEQARLVAEAKRKEEEKRRKEQEAREEKRLAQIREDALRRMQAMAGTGGPSSAGTAARSSGPSAGWGAKVQARVRPNIVFADHVDGNPKAEVEVRTSPDGTIVGKRLVRSSGVKAWDEAVLRALDKTEALPRDVDGRVPSPVVIEFRPKG